MSPILSTEWPRAWAARSTWSPASSLRLPTSFLRTSLENAAELSFFLQMMALKRASSACNKNPIFLILQTFLTLSKRKQTARIISSKDEPIFFQSITRTLLQKINHEQGQQYCIENKMKLVQRKRMNSLREAEDNTMRSRSKRPVEKRSHRNNRTGWMSKMLWMLKMVCSFGWFGDKLSKMHWSPA